DQIVSLALSTTCVYGKVEGRLTRLQISCQKKDSCWNFNLETTFKLLVSASAMNLLGS
ncbi:hypothetical protein MKW92_009355, partial [Papaver armeniacum]